MRFGRTFVQLCLFLATLLIIGCGQSTKDDGNLGGDTGRDTDGGEDTGGEDTGGEDTGDEDTGDEDTGDEDTDDEDTDDEDTGDEDTGDEDTDDEDTGDEDTGDEDTGDEDTGDEDTGDEDTGDEDTGDEDTDDEDTGDEDTGDEDTGDEDTGDEDTGDEDTGDEDTGDEDTGDEDTDDEDTGDEDTGDEDTGEDDTDGYPSGPYGTQLYDTAEDFIVEECICSDDNATGKPLALSDFLGAKSVVITVHSGTCPYCKKQAATLEQDLYQANRSKGLEAMLLLTNDNWNRTNRDSLLKYCCKYKNRYGLTFPVGIDPEGETLAGYFEQGGVPMNIILDQNMEIRFKVEGYLQDAHIIEGTSAGICVEDTYAQNQLFGEFQMQMNADPDNNEFLGGTLQVNGKETGRAIYMEMGYAIYEESVPALAMYSVLTSNYYNFLSIQLPENVALDTPLEFGVTEGLAGVYMLLDVNSDGEIVGQLPVAEVSGGQITFTQFGTTYTDEVVGSFQVDLTPIE